MLRPVLSEDHIRLQIKNTVVMHRVSYRSNEIRRPHSITVLRRYQLFILTTRSRAPANDKDSGQRYQEQLTYRKYEDGILQHFIKCLIKVLLKWNFLRWWVSFQYNLIQFGYSLRAQWTTTKLTGTSFWVTMPCSLLKVNRRFGGTYRLHLRSRISRVKNQRESMWQEEPRFYACFLLGLLFDPRCRRFSFATLDDSQRITRH
jgi:hypothetical protein